MTSISAVVINKVSLLIYQRLISIILIALLVIQVICVVSWNNERREIADLIKGEIDNDASPVAKVHQTIAFMTSTIPRSMTYGSFLSPIFSPLKPTALQVIRGGGDCAYLSRAFIVILNQLGVSAHKITLFDQGRNNHAVVYVETESGYLIVDLLFYLIHEYENGDPIPLEQLADSEVLQSSVNRNSSGVQDPWKYPVDVYHYRDARSFNWNKLGPLDGSYELFSSVFGEKNVRGWQRPYITEEPALMVITIALIIQSVLLLLLMVVTSHKKRLNQ